MPPKYTPSQFIESLKTDGAVSSMFAQLSQRYPELVSPLVSREAIVPRSPCAHLVTPCADMQSSLHHFFMPTPLSCAAPPHQVSERDLYLAWSLKRSKAVNGAATVVGVLGKGHMRGVVHALRHDAGGLRFADLVGGANRKAARRAAAARRLAVELAIGGGAYAAWLQLTGGWP